MKTEGIDVDETYMYVPNPTRNRMEIMQAQEEMNTEIKRMEKIVTLWDSKELTPGAYSNDQTSGWTEVTQHTKEKQNMGKETTEDHNRYPVICDPERL